MPRAHRVEAVAIWQHNELHEELLCICTRFAEMVNPSCYRSPRANYILLELSLPTRYGTFTSPPLEAQRSRYTPLAMQDCHSARWSLHGISFDTT